MTAPVSLEFFKLVGSSEPLFFHQMEMEVATSIFVQRNEVDCSFHVDPFQPFLVTLILSASLALALHLQPFKNKHENLLEALVLITLLFSYGGSYGSSAFSDMTTFRYFVGVLNLLVLLVLIAAVLWPWIRILFERLRICYNLRRQRSNGVASAKELRPI